MTAITTAPLSAPAASTGMASAEHTGRLRDLVSLGDLTADDLRLLLARAAAMKTDRARAAASTAAEDKPLRGWSVAMIFEKPSLRTRVTFEVGVAELGGSTIYLSNNDIQLGVRESVADVARNLERWVHMIVARTFSHQTILDLAAHASVPVINALSDVCHPCQGLADLLTIQEHRGTLAGQVLAYIGDGNNVLTSLLLGGSALGMHVRAATPPGYEPPTWVVALAAQRARAAGGSVAITHDPRAAVHGADVLYTDVWTSMGFESERVQRMAVFQSYQVNSALVTLARPDAIVLHCLPAHRGEEITDDVLDGPHSVVLDQAENRLHAQKALMAVLRENARHD